MSLYIEGRIRANFRLRAGVGGEVRCEVRMKVHFMVKVMARVEVSVW